MLFPYSGNKTRMLAKLPPPPWGTHTIIEPFAGSAAYGLHYRPQRLVIAEASERVREMWLWLTAHATPQALRELERARPPVPLDVRQLGLDRPRETLLRLCCGGLYAGTLAAWKLYTQHRFNANRIIEALPYLQSSVVVLDDYKATAAYRGLFFVDPPYADTAPNYGVRRKDWPTPEDIRAFVDEREDPVLVTYGNQAEALFPTWPWRHATDIATAAARKGESRLREERFACLNWPTCATPARRGPT